MLSQRQTGRSVAHATRCASIRTGVGALESDRCAAICIVVATDGRAASDTSSCT